MSTQVGPNYKAISKDLSKMLRPLLDILDGNSIVLNDQEVLKLHLGLLNRNSIYCKELGFYAEERFSPIKVLAWAPYVLVEDLGMSENYFNRIIASSITLVEEELRMGKIDLNELWIERLIQIAQRGYDKNSSLTYCSIGLYSAFQTASKSAPSHWMVKKIFKLVRIIHGS